MTLRPIQAEVLGLVPPIFGRAAEGNIELDLQELTQVYSVGDVMLRSSLQRRHFIRTNVHGAAGTISTLLDFWAATNWTAISGEGGTTPGPVPQDHDVLVRAVGFSSSAGSNVLVGAFASVLYPAITGGSINAEYMLGSSRAGWGANTVYADIVSAPFLPYPMKRTALATLIQVFTEVSAISNVSAHIDVISAPAGIIPFA